SLSDVEPLLVRAAKSLPVERPPAWMMRQARSISRRSPYDRAGRYMKEYRDLAVKYPSFRERSENTDLIVEITLQPWRAFQPDGVILFSDILTPLPAIGIPFEIDDYKGPILDQPIRDAEGLKSLHELDLDMLPFVGEALTELRKEVGDSAAVLGFVGAPWTLATYIVEGGSSSTYKTIKSMAMTEPDTLHAILSAVADAVGTYVGYQIDAGAQCVQIFDSWGGQLPPHMWEVWSKPYIQRVVDKVRASHPGTPLTLYANGSGGLLERMATTGVDCIGLDWTIDMEDGRRRVGDKAVQGNVDPAVLFAPPEARSSITLIPAVEKAVQDVCAKAGPVGHILNLGHGVLVGTPEENVKAFFDAAKKIRY
ncbi:uroporphyrinogen decarboxylase chloroplast precursor, partial [Micromonas pusilla CCMP1545]